MAVFRPLFNRHDTFVVVKSIRLTSSEILMPGEKVSLSEYGRHRLMYWWKRRSIAKDGCDWANSQLEKTEPKSKKSVASEAESDGKAKAKPAKSKPASKKPSKVKKEVKKDG